MFASVGKMLIGVGVMILFAGAIFMLVGRFGVNRLPGDIVIQRGRATFFFPVVTCLVLSLVLSLIMSLLARWRR